MQNQDAQKLNYFKLLDQPFDNTRDTRFFYESDGHGEALSRLLFLTQDKNMGMGMLTGEIGCGKTITRTVLHNRLPASGYKVVSLENCLLDFDGLLLEILSQLENQRINPDDLPDRYSRLSAFKKALVDDIHKAGKHLVLLLDEAQMLTDESLDRLKGLTHISSERANFLSVILIGQPELRTQIKRMPQVDQRISLRYHLNPLAPEEVPRYLMFRMKVAGLNGPAAFTQESVQIIADASRGIPREINRICKLGMDHAFSHSLPRLDSRVIELVVRDLYRQGGSPDNDESSIQSP